MLVKNVITELICDLTDPDDAENMQNTDRWRGDEYSPDLRKENLYGRHEGPDGGGRRSSGRRIF